MKHVFDSSEVAHVWANQQQNEGRNSNNNFYFRNQTIYSYGSHFPIATIKGNDVFFTLRSYSNTTAKHISRARQAISHKDLIYVYDVPVYFDSLTGTHENNMNYWKKQINSYFNELGNKRIRDTQSRINSIQQNITQLTEYCNYFKLTVKDKELKDLLKIAASENFVDQARQAKDKLNAANERTMKQAVKAHEQYINLWRKYDNEGIKNLSPKVKELCTFYNLNTASFTRLRLNTDENRLETSKGVQIPVEIAKRAFKQLNGCMEGNCKDINVPVMNYAITETTKDSIIAGCHTIPKTDVKYIADLLKWS